MSPAAGTRDDDVAIRLTDVTKTFGKGDSAVPALRGATLEARYGESTFLVGPSGCGKTTLISIVAGLLHRDGGAMSVLGTDLGSLSRGQLTRWRSENVGFIFQAFNLIPQLTVAENVSVPLVIRGVRRREALRKAAAILDAVGLGGRERSRPNKLSGGQQQRVAIARSLVHDPRILVCDEPTSALDASVGWKVMQQIAAVSQHPDRAVLVVTHDERIFPFAHRIAHMDDGRIKRVDQQSHQPLHAGAGAPEDPFR
ncbi:MAG: ABC transporter ATP-binding protein [Phycisphaerae bacterium]|nr:ABC transporter ATP-binding protein [Phycisphaerae bacterium]